MSRINSRRIKDDVRKQHRQQWQQRLTRLTVVILGCSSVLFSGWWLNQSFSINTWHIQANDTLKTQIEHELAAMKALDFMHSRPDTLQQTLLQRIPDIASLHIQRQLPDTLYITATARQNIALWQHHDGLVYLVDNKGNAYRQRRASEHTDLPFLRLSKDKLTEAVQLLLQMQSQQTAWYHATSEVFAEANGWKINFTNRQQWFLPFGQRALNDMAHLTTLLKQARWQRQHWRINTRLGDRWFFRPARQGGLV